MKRVLVVEDYPSLQTLYKFALENSGYEVDVCDSGAEALTMAAKNKYDIILLDLLLRGMSGIEFLHKLKAPKRLPATKIIVISNIKYPEIAKEAKVLGAEKFFLKSDFMPKDIAKILNEELGAE